MKRFRNATAQWFSLPFSLPGARSHSGTARLFTALLLLLSLCGCGAQQTEEATRVELSGGNVPFHNFTIAAKEVEDRFQVEIFHDGVPASSDAEIFTDVDMDGVLTDFPARGCETRKVNLFTGGANCCFGYYLLSACPKKDAAAYVPPLDGGIGPSSMDGAFSVTDPFFMYYEKADPGQEGVSFSRVNSPRPERLIIFEQGAWRIDRRGEFPAYYREQADALDGDPSIDPAARAIVKGYYAIMAGEDLTSALHTFKEGLPERFTSLASEIFTDLETSSREFNPVEPLRLR